MFIPVLGAKIREGKFWVAAWGRFIIGFVITEDPKFWTGPRLAIFFFIKVCYCCIFKSLALRVWQRFLSASTCKFLKWIQIKSSFQFFWSHLCKVAFYLLLYWIKQLSVNLILYCELDDDINDTMVFIVLWILLLDTCKFFFWESDNLLSFYF